jgi:dolichyl-phosphate beta-glucosyltransferase
LLESLKNIQPITHTTMKLSIVIPAYNEELNISDTLKDIASYLKDKDYEYEVILSDDGSTDKTAKIAELFKDLPGGIIILKHTENHGKGYAVKKGVLSAKGDLILFMDADNATRINQLDKFMPFASSEYEVVLASRRMQGAEIAWHQPWYRIVLGNIYILLSKIILGSSVSDYNCGFKLYKKNAAKLLFSKLTRNDWSFDSELIYLTRKFGIRSISVPVRWEDKAKTSKVKPLRDGIKSLLSLIAIRINDIKGAYGKP